MNAEQYLESQDRDMRRAYITALMEARRYYDSCKKLGIVPNGGLQKVAYDLGSKVDLRKDKKTNRKFLTFVEKIDRLMAFLSLETIS